MNKKIATIARGLTACLALTAGLGVAQAHDDYVAQQQGRIDRPLQYLVRYPDLNLSSVEGVAALYGRLRTAAEMVCPQDGDKLSQWARQRPCENKAIGDAVSSIDSPLLTQYYQQRTKGDRAAMAVLAKNQ